MSKLWVPNTAPRNWEWTPLSDVVPFDFAITDCFEAEMLCANAESRPTILVSIWDRGTEAHTKYKWTRAASERTYIFEFDDATDGNAPKMNDLLSLLSVSHLLHTKWDPAEKPKVLFHCSAGYSRSPAAALVVLAELVGPARAVGFLQEAVSRTKGRGWRELDIKPNPVVVALGDELLGLHGDLVRAHDEVWGKKDVE